MPDEYSAFTVLFIFSIFNKGSGIYNSMANKCRIIIFLALLCLVLTNSIWAIELPFINKSKIRHSVAPGESIYGEIIVENGSSETRSLKVYLEDWYYLPAADGSKQFVPAGSTALSCANWVSFSPSELTLEPFSKKKVNYSIKVPLNAKGGYYAALFFESIFGKLQAEQERISAVMNIAVRIATLFYVEAEGTTKREAEVKNLSCVKKDRSDTYSVEIDFLNTGNVDITTDSSCHIMDGQGMVYARGQFNDAYTFPQGSAKLIADCKGKIPKGNYDLILTIDLGKALQEAGMGRGPVITKEAQITIGDSGEVLSSSQLK